MKKKKIKIIKELKNLIKKNSFIKDIWLYGNIDDQISDLDILILYDKKICSIKIPKIIKDKIYDGTIIFIPFNKRYTIFLFEQLNIFSIKNNKKIFFRLKKRIKKYQLLTSFLEKYYERRNFIFSGKMNTNSNSLRHIKSLLFSYSAFYDYKGKSNLEKKKLFNDYQKIRKKFINKNILKKEFLNYYKSLKKFDKKFFKVSFNYLEKKFSKTNIKSFSFIFRKKYKFKNPSQNPNLLVPKVFGLLYYVYSNFNLEISKKIKKDFYSNDKINKFLSIEFYKFLEKKIMFINETYLILLKLKKKKGLYRLSWYL